MKNRYGGLNLVEQTGLLQEKRLFNYGNTYYFNDLYKKRNNKYIKFRQTNEKYLIDAIKS